MADADSTATPAARAPKAALAPYSETAVSETAVALDALHRALRLLGAASADWQCKGPTDGAEPLHWPAAVAAARAHVEFAIRQLRREP